MIGTSPVGWASHTQAVAKFMELRGPEVFASGISHQLFIEFRIFVVSLR